MAFLAAGSAALDVHATEGESMHSLALAAQHLAGARRADAALKEARGQGVEEGAAAEGGDAKAEVYLTLLVSCTRACACVHVREVGRGYIQWTYIWQRGAVCTCEHSTPPPLPCGPDDLLSMLYWLSLQEFVLHTRKHDVASQMATLGRASALPAFTGEHLLKVAAMVKGE